MKGNQVYLQNFILVMKIHTRKFINTIVSISVFFFSKIDNFLIFIIYVLQQNVSMTEKRSQIITEINKQLCIYLLFFHICMYAERDRF